MVVLGIDVGSTGCKVIAFDPDGRLLKGAYRSYPMFYRQPGWRELDAEQVFAAVQECIDECCAEGIESKVRALSVSVQGEAMIPVDRHGARLQHGNF
jgi:xylulokinase